MLKNFAMLVLVVALEGLLLLLVAAYVYKGWQHGKRGDGVKKKVRSIFL